jgi:hypothetical protein
MHAQSPLGKTTPPVESRQLFLVERKELKSEVGGTLILPERCDGDGNLYLRIGADESAIIRKISPDGKKAMSDPRSPAPTPGNL